MARACPLCGAPNSTCGPSHTSGTAVTFTTRERGISVGKLQHYTFINADGREVTLRLTEADAKKRGLASKAAAKPANKSRTAANKG